MIEVFISYAKDDGKDLAEHLKEALKRIGVSSFVADIDIPNGADWEDTIQMRLNECGTFIVILSPIACTSSECVRDEIKTAINSEKKIIPCRHYEVKREIIPNNINALQQKIVFRNAEDLARQVLVRIIPKDILSQQIPIVNDSDKTGIYRIFKSRRHDLELDEKLKAQLKGAKDDVLMMGNALWSFFGETTKVKEVVYRGAIEESLNKGTEFKVLLLDPTSEAAKERAIIEHGDLVEKDSVYIESELYTDIKRVTEWLYDPPVDEDTKKKFKKQIEVRYSTIIPTAFIVKTDNFTFIEQYHLGSLMAIGLSPPNTYGAHCLGGYVPFFMVSNKSNIAKLMQSHFWRIWDKMEHKTLKEVYENMGKFEDDPKNYRIQQFIKYVKEISEEL